MANPTYLKVDRRIAQPLDAVWDTVALGFGDVAHYNPEIRESRLDSEQRSGVGTRRHCDFPKTGFIKEKVIEWNDRESFRIELVESSVPMGFLESKFSFQDDGGGTLVTQEFWYRMKPPMGWLSGLMKGRMRATLENGLEGLEKYMAAK